MRPLHRLFLGVAFCFWVGVGFIAGAASVATMDIKPVFIKPVVMDKRITDERTRPGEFCIEVCDIPQACYEATVSCVVGCLK